MPTYDDGKPLNGVRIVETKQRSKQMPINAPPMTTEQAMVEAHKIGRVLAKNGAPRDEARRAAYLLPVGHGDALLAGYYGELCRLAPAR